MSTRRLPAGMNGEGEFYEDTWELPYEQGPQVTAPAASTEWPGAPAGWTNPYPGASFGDNPSGITNRQNPTADPSKPFVQAGTTGGYQVGIGVTRRAGTSQTQAEYDAAKAAAGAYAREHGGDLEGWLKQNPEDEHRYIDAMESDGGGPTDEEEARSAGLFRMPAGGNGGGSDVLRSTLQSLWGGQGNQNIINSRLSNARDTLERQRKSTVSQNQAYLANRGLMGSGPEASMHNKVSTDIADRFANAATGIYADESENADQRMMQALGLSAGLDSGDADRALQALLGQQGNELGWFNANTQRDLGMGNLALGNMNGVNNYNLGLANFGLQRDLGLAGLENQDVDQLIDLLRQLLQGAGQSAQGFR